MLLTLKKWIYTKPWMFPCPFVLILTNVFVVSFVELEVLSLSGCLLNFFAAPGPSKGYLMVSTNGGLNQMRAGVSISKAIPLWILLWHRRSTQYKSKTFLIMLHKYVMHSCNDSCWTSDLKGEWKTCRYVIWWLWLAWSMRRWWYQNWIKVHFGMIRGEYSLEVYRTSWLKCWNKTANYL